MKRITRVGFLSLFLGVALLSFIKESRAWDAKGSSDPFEVYGNCGGSETGLYESKGNAVLDALVTAGKPATLKNVLAIRILSCKTASGGGGAFMVPCGSPYTYCVGTNNDGLGHEIRLGVVTRNGVTDPNAKYSGCTGGGIPQSKLALYQAAGGDALMINGIVTLQCGAAAGPSEKPKLTSCPGISPFKYCVQTSNDGHGNAVLLGAIGANGAGDPYALYGNCTSHGEGQPGFRAKAEVLTDLGISLDTVRTIDMVLCINPSAAGLFFPIRVVDCSSSPGTQSRIYYNKCVAGLDAKRNFLSVGIK